MGLYVKKRISLAALLLLLCPAMGSTQSTGSVSRTDTSTRSPPDELILRPCASPTPAELQAVRKDLLDSTENLRKFKASERPLKLFWRALVAYYTARRSTCEALTSENGVDTPKHQNISAEDAAGCRAYSAAISVEQTYLAQIQAKVAALQSVATQGERALRFELRLLMGVTPTPEEARAHAEAYGKAPVEVEKLGQWLPRVREQGNVDASRYDKEKREHLENLAKVEARARDCKDPSVNLRRFR